ncbi:MAG: UDP-N-acetyl-D-mannosamine dehydrogenase [Alphaproteobacteria bacterium]|nr:UDP-N-acetyl-D-mannosamine dehydrogenase [Alphaproteobacteria bacterium]
MKFEKISVIGLGYIGLPTAAVLASRGVQVIGVDVNQRVVDALNKGQVTIVEPDLDMVVHAAVTTGKMSATTTPEPADAFLVAVPTPFKDDHVPDLSYIEKASKAVAPVLKAGNLVILESTSPVGATEQMAQWMAEIRPDLTFSHQAGDDADVHVAHCPERVLPGHVMRELVENDRVIGGLSPKATDMAEGLYRIFVTGECLKTDARTAELCKLVENSFRDVNIAFANELSLIADRFGIDVWELIRLANHHPRVNVLRPGPGVGGHCIAVDPWFIVHSAPDQARLIRTAREVNDHKPHYVIEKVVEAAKGLKQPQIACLGLAFKADIDDLRESPSLDIVKRLAEAKLGTLLVVEPYVDEMPKSLQGHDHLKFVDVDEAVKAADIILVLVNHKPFLAVDRSLLEGKHVIDACGAWL